MRRKALTLVTLLLVAALGSACGSKRKPAVTAAPPPVDAGSGSRPSDTTAPSDAGDDLRPLSDEGASGSDLALSDAGGAGRPLGDIRFDYDAATLSDEARATLEKHALWLQNRRELRVTIEGHCDERGTVEYNLALGEQRARAARDYLVNLGVSAERLSTVSYGKERPLDPGQGESAWSRNRRAHFAVRR